MSSLKCPVVQDLLISYADGETSRETADEIELHLKECDECSENLKSLKVAPAVLHKIEKTKPDRIEIMIVKRAINRLRLTAATLIVLSIFFGLGSAVLGSVFGMSQKAEVGRRAFNMLITMVRPGVMVYGSQLENKGIYSKIATQVVRRVGNSVIPVANQEARVSLLGNLTLTSGHERPPFSNLSLPFPLRPGFEFPKEVEKNTQFIALMPNGLEVEGVVSFKKNLTPEETDVLIKKYNGLVLTWAAFKTQSDEEIAESQKAGYIGHLFGFPVGDLGGGNILAASTSFTTELDWLGEKYEKTQGVMQYPRIDEAAAYVKKNGLLIYGGVVTGSSEAIKKLLQDENVRHIELGEIRMLKP